MFTPGLVIRNHPPAWRSVRNSFHPFQVLLHDFPCPTTRSTCPACPAAGEHAGYLILDAHPHLGRLVRAGEG